VASPMSADDSAARAKPRSGEARPPDASADAVIPTVTIGVPVRNGERYLRGALDALLSQDYRDFELLISDNASTDGTTAIAMEYAARDPRVSFYRSDATLSPAGNFNRLLELARGRYFMWAANDDLWEPQFVGTLVELLERNPAAVLAFCRFDNLDDVGNCYGAFAEDWSAIFRQSKFRQYAAMVLLDETQSRKANHIYGLMRTDVLRTVGGFASLAVDFSGEDIVSLLRLLARGEFVSDPRVLFHYRIHAPRGRSDEPIARYVARRLVRPSPGHRGSFVLFFRRHHCYHASVRHVLLHEAPLARHERLLLYLADWARELLTPWQIVPPAIARELGLWKPKPPARSRPSRPIAAMAGRSLGEGHDRPA
jgi:glycosyltransferase involved in cell wall biosynthesis